MIEVELPDGSIAEFPDGTPETVMRTALLKRTAGGEKTTAKTDRLPEHRGVFRRVDDAVRGVADMASFGFADEIAAGLGSLTGIGGQQGDYDANVAAQRERDANGGWERLGGQVAGAFANPSMIARSLPQAVAQGAAMGGAYGFGSGDGEFSDRMKSAGVGAFTGGAGGAAVHKIADALIGRAARAAIPDNAELRAISQAGYDAAENAGVIVGPQGMRQVATDTVNDLANFGYHPTIQPKIGSILNEMERLANTNSTYKGLDTLRKIAGQVANSQDPAERAMASRIIGRLDDYMENIPARDLIAGDATKASEGIKKGRENWARMRRDEMVDTARIKAERRAESTGTGGNLDNTIRQNVRSILDNPKRSRGMTQAEKDMAERVVRGSPGQNMLRQIGRLSPTTGGLSAAMNVGATAMNPMMAGVGALGFAAKSVADRMTVKNADKLGELIRSGGFTAKELAKMAKQGKGNAQLVQAAQEILEAGGKLTPATARLVEMLRQRVVQ